MTRFHTTCGTRVEPGEAAGVGPAKLKGAGSRPQIKELCRERMSIWAWSVRDRKGPIVVDTLPFRERLELYVAVAVTTPRRLAPYFYARFLRWAPMLGDRWLDFQRDVTGVVVKCLPDGVVLELASGQFEHAYGLPWDAGYPDGCVPVYETVLHNDFNWWRWMVQR